MECSSVSFYTVHASWNTIWLSVDLYGCSQRDKVTYANRVGTVASNVPLWDCKYGCCLKIRWALSDSVWDSFGRVVGSDKLVFVPGRVVESDKLFVPGHELASFSGQSQILSCSCGKKSIFLHSCEFFFHNCVIKSGTGLRMRLTHDQVQRLVYLGVA